MLTGVGAASISVRAQTGVISTNEHHARHLARQLDAGTVWINTWDAFDAALPFGGYKASGIGRDLGDAALASYQEVKTTVFGDPYARP